MFRDASLLLTLLAVSGLTLCADQVTLDNGDRVTGAVVKKDAKSLTFKSDAFGAITIPWSKVREISTESPVFVVLPGDRTVQGTIATKDGRLQVTTTTSPQDSSLADLIAIRSGEEQAAYERLLNPSWTQAWAGSATVGLAGTVGNARSSTFVGSLDAARPTNTDKTTVYFKAIRSSALVNGVSGATAQAV